MIPASLFPRLKALSCGNHTGDEMSRDPWEWHPFDGPEKPDLACSKCHGPIIGDEDFADDGFGGVTCRDCTDAAREDALEAEAEAEELAFW